MDSFAAMQVFVRVVEAGSLSAAGRALGLAPSSVTRRINELEAALGVRLLQRTTRKLSLTEAGETYYERAREIMGAVEEATLAVTERRGVASGILRVTVPASLARRHMAPAAADFMAQFPAVKVAMTVTDRMVDLVGEGMDLAIRVGRLEDSSLLARKVGEARRLLCASPAYLERAGSPASPADLTEYACLCFRDHPGRTLWRFRKAGRRADVRVSGPLVANDGEALVAAALAGLGLVLVPAWLVGSEVGDGRLVALLPDHDPDPPSTPLYAVFPPGPYSPIKVRAFVDFLAARFAGEDAWSERQSAPAS